MTREGPYLQTLTDHLAASPEIFLARPAIFAHGVTDAYSLASDTLLHLGAPPLKETDRKKIERSWADAGVNAVTALQIAAWVLHHPVFENQSTLSEAARKALLTDLLPLGKAVSPEEWLQSSDRREEWVRQILFFLGLRPKGESENEASDRLSSLDTLARLRVHAESQEKLKRVREIQEAARKKAAQQAANVYGGE